jgi:hypothetical protein
MKRLLLIAAGVAAVVTASAVPVFADQAAPANSDPRADSNLVAGTEKGIAGLVNPILAGIPAPEGWHQRFLCAWNYQTDQQVCLYFPYPT